jgi:hypothetical protein
VSVDNLTTGKTVTASAFNSTSGYQFRGADATAYETLRYVGGTNNPGLFTSVDEASKKVRLNATGSIAAGHELCLGAEGTQDVFKVGAANVTVSTGNAIFGGTGQRITGDMSNATLTNRLALQTSTTNGNTAVTVLPNGTSTTAQVLAYNNSDPTNASNGAIIATATAIRVSSGQSGSGTYLPLAFYTSGGEKAVVDTSGNLKVNNGDFIVGTTGKGLADSAGNLKLAVNTTSVAAQSVLSGGLTHRKGVYTPGATTPSAVGVSYFDISNSSATSITNFTGAVEGQMLLLVFRDANTTITRNNAYLAGSANFTSATNATLLLISDGTNWFEVCRSTTNG